MIMNIVFYGISIHSFILSLTKKCVFINVICLIHVVKKSKFERKKILRKNDLEKNNLQMQTN